MEKQEALTHPTPHTEPSQRKFLCLAIPNIVSNLTVPIAGLIDMAFLGHLPSVVPLAGVALAAIIFDYLYWGLGFLRMGTTGLTAQAYGRKDTGEQGSVFWRGMAFAFILSTLLLGFRAPIADFSFWLLRGDQATELAGQAYYYARIWGAFPVLGIYVINGWLLGRQLPKSVLLITGCLSGLNICLDYLFIVVFGWEAAGAGLATMISEWTAFLLACSLVKRAWPVEAPGPLGTRWALDTLRPMLALSGHLIVRTFFLLTTFAAFLNLSATMGTLVLAANAILLRFLNTAAYFIDGWAFTLESLAGEYSGAGDRKSLDRSLKLGLGWTGATVLAFLYLFVVHGQFLLSLLTSHKEVVAIACTYLPFLYFILILAGGAYLLDGYFIGLTRGAVLSRAMLLSALGFLPWAVAAYFVMDPALLWLGLLTFMGLRALTLFVALRHPHPHPHANSTS